MLFGGKHVSFKEDHVSFGGMEHVSLRGGISFESRSMRGSHVVLQYIDSCWHPHASQGKVLGRGVSPLPTGYDWHGDALVSQSR